MNAPAVPVDFSAWGINDATAQFGMQLGQSAVAAGQDYMQKNVREQHCLRIVTLTHLYEPIAGGSHSYICLEASFQCLKLICDEQITHSSLSVEAQTLVSPGTSHG